MLTSAKIRLRQNYLVESGSQVCQVFINVALLINKLHRAELNDPSHTQPVLQSQEKAQ